MKRFTKIALVLVLLVAIAVAFTGCEWMTEAEKVSQNISKQANLFNVTRRVTVLNARTDTVLLEIIGNLSVLSSSGDIDIIVEVAPGHYKKHFVRLDSWTIYVVEDISGAFVDPYHYEINFLPESIVPFKFTMDY